MGVIDKSSRLVQGTLDMLILKTLELVPMHGYGIAQRIEQVSNQVFRVNAGSLFPALRRLERDALIEASWQLSDSHRKAKYYALTPDGRAVLTRQTRDWSLQTTAIANILYAR